MQKMTPLTPGCYYHIYNRGNNKEPIFLATTIIAISSKATLNI